jgi:hypothetical protein
MTAPTATRPWAVRRGDPTVRWPFGVVQRPAVAGPRDYHPPIGREASTGCRSAARP